MNRKLLVTVLGGIRRTAVGAVITCLFAVPGLYLLYGGLAGAIGGVGIICAFVVIQLPLFFILRRLKITPTFTLGLPPAPKDSAPREEWEASAVQKSLGADSGAENNLIQRP